MKNYVRPELKVNEERMENVALFSGEPAVENFACAKASNRYRYDYSPACQGCPNAYGLIFKWCKGADGVAFNGK